MALLHLCGCGNPARRFTADRKASGPVLRARRAEASYARDLRKLARHIGDLVAAFPAGDPAALPQMRDALERYGQAIAPWALAVAGRMLAEVAAREAAGWAETTRAMGRALREEIRNAPTGEVLRAQLAEQVELITSLPREAAERVHRLTLKGLETSERASEVAREIMRTGEVTEARARLIARTETSRTATLLTRARAEYVGSEQFIWRTSGDSDVRPSHRRLNGRAFRWDDPPECDPGHRALPGAIFNCRCYPEPVLPEVAA